MNNQTYFAAQRWAKEQLSGQNIDPGSPRFLLKERHGWDDTCLLYTSDAADE